MGFETVQSGFESVAEQFAEFAAAQPGGGLALAVMVDGETVVDLQAGESRPGVPWGDDTVTVNFSCTKGLTAVLVAQLVQEGALAADDPVAKWWPEFASVSERLTVRQLLEHRAGLAAVRRNMSLDEVLDHDTLIAELLRQGPLWEPGTGHSYHAFTFGTLADELVRRVTGSTVGELFQERLARPLGVDAWIGLPASKEARVAQLIPAGSFVGPRPAPGSIEDYRERALSFGDAFAMPGALEPGTGFNDPRVHQASLPGVNMITNARGLATLWSSVVTTTRGVRTLSDETVRWLSEPTVNEPPVWEPEPPHHIRGFGVMLGNPAISPLLSEASFGHDGFGGQAGYADLKYRASLGFVSNWMVPGVEQHHRWHALMATTRAALEAQS